MRGGSNCVEVNADQNPYLCCGTKDPDGYGRMIDTSIGMNTTWGEKMNPISRDTDNLIMGRLHKLTSTIGKFDMVAAFLLLVIWLVRYFTGNFNRSKMKATDILCDVFGILAAAAVTALVVATPECLTLAVRLALASSVKRMMADHETMVKRISETMVSATTICIDRHATSLVKVTEVWLGQMERQVSSSSVTPYVLDLVAQGVALNTAFSPYKQDPDSDCEGKALVSWGIDELQLDVEKLKHSFIILQILNSEKKWRGIVIKKKLDNTLHVHLKGAPEKMLVMCTSYYDASSGKESDLNDHRRKILEEILQGMAAKGLRCIALSHKQISEEEYQEAIKEKKLQENSFTLLGIAGMSGLCLLEAQKAVNDCQNEEQMERADEILGGLEQVGGKVAVTGNNIDVNYAPILAEADIGLWLGIQATEDKKAVNDCQNEEQMERTDEILGRLEQEGREVAVTGNNIDVNYAPILGEADIGLSLGIQATEDQKAVNDCRNEEQRERADEIRTPFKKPLMVGHLELEGHEVAVTGNNLDINDAPVLAEADIGMSLGIQGTEDIIVLNRNFPTTAAIVTSGRHVHLNIQKIVQLHLINIVAAFVITSVTAISSDEIPPQNAKQLWVNLIMDTLAVIALASEKPTEEFMANKPLISKTEPLITNRMWTNLLTQASYQIAVCLTLHFKGKTMFGVSEKVNNTLIFNTSVLCQIFNMMNARKLEERNVLKGIHRNRLFLAAIAVSIIFQVIIVELLTKFGGAVRLDGVKWGVSIGLAGFTLPVGWLGKRIPLPEKPMFSYIAGWQ